MAKVFLIEDNENLREAVASYLRLDGHDVVEFPRIRGLHEAVENQAPDLLVLDVMLPDGDGFLVAKNLRQKHDVPIIFMTARSSESDRITGFELGGDDYIVKPFSPKELTLRVQAILRRTGGEATSERAGRFEYTGILLEIDEEAHRITVDGSDVALTAAEWRILTYLSGRAPSVVDRTRLLTESLDYIAEGSERTIDTHVKNIRVKLGDPGWIETVRGFGYRFAGNPR